MRLGILEIAIIIIVIIVILLITRILRFKQHFAAQSKNASADTPTDTTEKNAGKKRNLLSRASIAFILTGIIMLIAGISLFRWAVQSYMWALAIVAIGLALSLLSKHK